MSLKPPDPVYVLRGALHPISSTAFSLPETHDGTVKYLASGTQQGLVSIWNLKVRGTQMNWQAHKSSVLWLKFVESFKLWTEGRNDAAILWDINDGSAKEICQFPINQYLGFSQCNVIKLGDRSYLSVPGPSQESVTLWDVNSCIKICTLTPSDVKLCGSVMQCRWIQSESNLYILIIYESGQLCLWDWPNRKILSEINCKDNPIYVEYDETLARGICGTVSEKVFSFLLHKESAKLEYETEFSIKNPGIGCIATRPDSKIYAMGGWDHRIRLYSWKKHKPLAVLFYHKNSIECLDFSKGPVETLSKGYLLAAGSGDNSISLWDIYN